MTTAKGYIFAVTSLVFMSLAGPLQKQASVNGHPLFVTACSCSAAFLIALIVCIYQRKSILKQIGIPIVNLSILYTLAMILFSYSVSLENPFVVSAVARSYIAFSFLLAAYSLKESHSQQRWLAILVIVLGTLAVSFTGASGHLYISMGTLLAFVYALLFAIHNAYLKKNSGRSVLAILFWQNIFAATTTLALSFFIIPAHRVSSSTLIFGALSGLFSSFIGFLFYHQSIRYLSFGEATSIRAFSPIIGALIIAPFFPPAITPLLCGGFILILIGHYFYFKSEVTYASATNRRILSIFKRKRNPI